MSGTNAQSSYPNTIESAQQKSMMPCPVMRVNACSFDEQNTIDDISERIAQRARLLNDATTPIHIRKIIRKGSGLSLEEIFKISEDVRNLGSTL